MAEAEDECELTALVSAEDGRDSSPPPMSPIVIDNIPNTETSKIANATRTIKTAITPTSPISNKLSSSGANSWSSKSVPKSSITNPRYLHVNSKLNNVSRRPSLLSDSSSRTPREQSSSIRMTSMKRDSSYQIPSDPSMIAPILSLDSHLYHLCRLESNTNSSNSSQLTTKAQVSEPDNAADACGSSETLKPNREHFGSSTGLHHSDAFVILQPTKSGHTGLRHVASSAFIKSFFGNNRNHQRNIQQPSFVSDTTDVRQMEQALLQLLGDFHSGKLRAFAQDSSMEQMQEIREQQERLGRLHFELGAQQEFFKPLSSEGLTANQDKMQQLMSSLQELSLSIEKLQSFRRGQSSEGT